MVAKDVMEVEVRRRTVLALSKAALLETTRIDAEKSRLGLVESLIMHQVCGSLYSAQSLKI